MRRFWTITLLAMFTVLVGALGLRVQISAPVASAAQSWEIQVGGEPAPAVSAISFYPRVLTVAEGDTVNFEFPSLLYHGVSFDAGDEAAFYLGGFRRDFPNQGDIDVTGSFSPLNVSVSPVPFDGSRPISSGVPLAPPGQRRPFSVIFPRAGVYHFECPFHGPPMEGDITVLAAGSNLPETPDQAITRGAGEASADYAVTLGMQKIVPTTQASELLPAGTTVHSVNAGGTGYKTSILEFGPRDLAVNRGDYIIWSLPNSRSLHTVTFLSGSSTPAFFQQTPLPDGSTGIVLPAASGAPSGGRTYRGTGILNSGLLSPGDSFIVTVDAPPGTYEYVCLFHVTGFDMRGTITVLP